MFALALLPLSASGDKPPRALCKHGCYSRYCRESHCGNKCHVKCHGCWKYWKISL